jgi:hypothetical protein
VQAELGEADALHFPVGRMVFDPVGVAAEAVAMVQDRGALIRLQGKLVEASASELAETLEIRREMPQRRLVQVEPQEIADGAVDGPKIQPAAIGRNQVGTGRGDGGHEIARQDAHGGGSSGRACGSTGSLHYIRSGGAA